MPKRKRDGSEASGSGAEGVDGRVSIRQHRVEQKLEHGHKLLARAFKTAKGFEKQKSGRRRKTAGEKQDEKEVTRIEAETAALKTLDLSAAARNYLYKSLIKFKAVAESPDLPKAVSKPPAPINDSAKANVIARLCNSNPVKEALAPILTDIQRALGIEPKDVAKGKKRLRAKDIEKQGEEDGKNKAQKAAVRKPQAAADDESGDVSMAEAEDDQSDQPARRSKDAQEAGSGSDDEFAEFNDRLAGSSEDESEDGQSDDDAGLRKGKQSRAAALRAALAETADVPQSQSPSPSPSESASPSPEPESPPPKTTKPGTSAFVPSLTMGGYWSGSESEPEDFDDEQPKKNRRGQRARRLLAEKKFGRNAKHLQKQEVAGKKDRNAGWDPKRGATDGSGPRGRGGPRSRFERTPGGSDRGINKDGAAGPPQKKHRDDQGALHPSWEAAKKAKEAKKVTAAFEGKKITFD